MSFKPLFSQALGAAPDRLHFAAHSHHLWPDASRDGQIEAWDDGVSLADRKWAKVMGPLWDEAQRAVADELGTAAPDAVAFSPNTHDFIIRLAAACPRSDGAALRILASDSEFHSARRQFERWIEEGTVAVETVPAEPFDTFDARFMDRASSGAHDLLFVSQVMFSNGHVVGAIDEVAALGRPDGPWVVIDGYHAFMAVAEPFSEAAGQTAFYLGGGYKYAMAGEGVGFLHAPQGFGPRPPVTGWFAEFDDLKLPLGMVGYAPDARRFLGATFDPSGLYRFVAVRRMLAENGLDTARISAHCRALQRQLLDAIDRTPLAGATLLNPLGEGDHARFLAFRSHLAADWQEALLANDCVTDVRGDVLRIGFGLYQDENDVDRLVGLLKELP